ncbi:MAG: efflux RND transporter periplasmic adaptor subunit [candidate division WOR-3 bacterium]
MKRIIKTLTILLVGVVLVMLNSNCRQQKAKTEKRKATTVSAVTVEPKTVSRTVNLFGVIYGEEQVVVTPKIMGRVIRIVKGEGSTVNAGDTILYILNDMPGMDYQPGPVLSPIAGMVGKVYVEIGQTVNQATPVAMVSKFSENVRVKAPISDLDLPYVKKGAAALVSVTALANGVFQGRVSNISSILDPISGTATVEITIPNKDKKLIPGMACSISLLLEQRENVIALPLVALFTDGFSKVLVVDENNIARAREIKVGLVGNELVEIKDGLRIGERVITVGKERVSDGDEVKVVEVGQ